MRLELEPEGSAWRIVVRDVLLPKGSMDLGTVADLGGGAFLLTPGGQWPRGKVRPGPMQVQAPSLEALRALLEQRVRDMVRTDSEGDRMNTETMAVFVDASIVNLARLAVKVEQVPGFSLGLARAVGGFLCEHVKREGWDSFMDILRRQALDYATLAADDDSADEPRATH